MRRVALQALSGVGGLCSRSRGSHQLLQVSADACATGAAHEATSSTRQQYAYWAGLELQSQQACSTSTGIVRPANLHLRGRQPLVSSWSPGHARGIFIQTQSTPNPQSLMFFPGKPVVEGGSKMFPNARAAMVSPLATRLFGLDGVTGVHYGSDFITVTKKDDSVSWSVLKPDIFAAITDHLSSGEPLVMDDDELAASDTAIHPDDSEVVAMIKELLETRIRPAVQEDGGDIKYKNFDVDTGVVTVQMLGSCSGCPSSTVTLKMGVENMLMHYVPEVKKVVEDTTSAEEEGQDPLVTSSPAAHPMEQHLSP